MEVNRSISILGLVLFIAMAIGVLIELIVPEARELLVWTALLAFPDSRCSSPAACKPRA